MDEPAARRYRDGESDQTSGRAAALAGDAQRVLSLARRARRHPTGDTPARPGGDGDRLPALPAAAAARESPTSPRRASSAPLNPAGDLLHPSPARLPAAAATVHGAGSRPD